jgi:hypothetical protein
MLNFTMGMGAGRAANNEEDKCLAAAHARRHVAGVRKELRLANERG